MTFFKLGARVSAVMAVLVAPMVLACSLALLPYNAQPLVADAGLPDLDLTDGGTGDVTAPSVPVIGRVDLELVRNGCSGDGASCPELDGLSFPVTAQDAVTAPGALRFLAAFGDTAAQASSAAPTLLFSADPSAPATVSAILGFNRQRSGSGFDRKSLCFTLAAVDEAGNVSARSAATCADTTDESRQGTTFRTGRGCFGGVGCSAMGSTPALLGLLALLAWRRRQASPVEVKAA